MALDRGAQILAVAFYFSRFLDLIQITEERKNL
jgi:hypothetical protein